MLSNTVLHESWHGDFFSAVSRSCNFIKEHLWSMTAIAVTIITCGNMKSHSEQSILRCFWQMSILGKRFFPLVMLMVIITNVVKTDVRIFYWTIATTTSTLKCHFTYDIHMILKYILKFIWAAVLSNQPSDVDFLSNF